MFVRFFVILLLYTSPSYASQADLNKMFEELRILFPRQTKAHRKAEIFFTGGGHTSLSSIERVSPDPFSCIKVRENYFRSLDLLNEIRNLENELSHLLENSIPDQQELGRISDLYDQIITFHEDLFEILPENWIDPNYEVSYEWIMEENPKLYSKIQIRRFQMPGFGITSSGFLSPDAWMDGLKKQINGFRYSKKISLLQYCINQEERFVSILLERKSTHQTETISLLGSSPNKNVGELESLDFEYQMFHSELLKRRHLKSLPSFTETKLSLQDNRISASILLFRQEHIQAQLEELLLLELEVSKALLEKRPYQAFDLSKECFELGQFLDSQWGENFPVKKEALKAAMKRVNQKIKLIESVGSSPANLLWQKMQKLIKKKSFFSQSRVYSLLIPCIAMSKDDFLNLDEGRLRLIEEALHSLEEDYK